MLAGYLFLRFQRGRENRQINSLAKIHEFTVIKHNANGPDFRELKRNNNVTESRS